MIRSYVPPLLRGTMLFLLLTAAGCAGTAKETPPPENAWPVSAEDAAMLATPAENSKELRNQLRTLVATAPHPERIGACVREMNSPLAVFDHNGLERFVPVASQKLLTTAAALEVLGPNFRYLTRVLCAGRLEERVLRGNLLVIGSGDPTLGGRFARDPRDPAAVFRRWAADIRAAGIEKIDGAVIGNDNTFDDVTLCPDWPADETGESYLAEVSALSFNENGVDVFWIGGRKSGRMTLHETRPESNYYLFHNGVFTGKEGESPAVAFHRQPGTNLLQSRGTIPPKSEFHGKGTVSNPTVWCATVFRETLVNAGVEVVNPRGLDLDDANDSLSSQTWPVIVHRSPPLAEIVGATNRFNLNLTAEMLLKTLGKEKRGKGSFSAGCAVVKDFLEQNRLDGARDTVLRDGSGVSRRNAVSPRLVAALLKRMSDHPAAAHFETSLPRPGDPGALENFLRSERKENPALARRIQAVSGTCGVNCDLAGYVTTGGGIRLAFAFIVNDPDLSPKQAQALLERMILLCYCSK